jgi:hypothetical protein
MDEKKLIGLYSAKAAEQYGYSIYETPEGKTVMVTAACEECNLDQYGWEDKVVVGLVTKFVRSYSAENNSIYTKIKDKFNAKI